MHNSVVGCIVFAFSGSVVRFGGTPGALSALSRAAVAAAVVSIGACGAPILKSGISKPSDCHSLNNLCNANDAKCNMGTSPSSSLSFSPSAMSTSSRNKSSPVFVRLVEKNWFELKESGNEKRFYVLLVCILYLAAVVVHLHRQLRRRLLSVLELLAIEAYVE